MGEDLGGVAELELPAGEQGVVDRLVVLADDRDLGGVEGERVERRPHGAVGRVLERDEGALDLAGGDCLDRPEHGRRGDRVELRSRPQPSAARPR